MVTFGVTPEGFRRKTEEDILAEIEDDQRTEIAEDIDVSTDQVLGQNNGIITRQIGMVWEQLEKIYHGHDPEVSEGRLLEMVSKLTGTYRVGAQPSEVVLSCNLDDGTTLIAGEHFAAVKDKPDIRWTPLEDFTAEDGDDDYDVTFVSELKGPVEGFAGTITAIATPIVGWNSVTNAEDAELGDVVEEDPDFRVRRERELATVGSATIRAIKANISQAFPDDLEDILVFENEDDVTDSEGRPPHSVEAVLFDGEVPSIDNDAIAKVIYETSKAGGIQSYGNETGEVIENVNGQENTVEVAFSRAEQLEVYLEVDLTTGAGYVGDDEVKQTLATKGNARFTTGKTVIESVLSAYAIALDGVEDVVEIRLGFAPSPVGTANLPVGIRQIARFSTSRITVNS